MRTESPGRGVLRFRSAVAVVMLALMALAVGALAQDPDVQTAMALMSGDRSAKVRAQAALTLRAAGEQPEVRTALIAALGDGDEIGRAHV